MLCANQMRAPRIVQRFANNSEALRDLYNRLEALLQSPAYRGRTDLAIVSDIDATALTQSEGSDSPRCCVGVNRIYQLAMKYGVHWYFVTARVAVSDTLAWTRRALAKCGFSVYDGLFLRKMKESGKNLQDGYSRYKAKRRALIHHNHKLEIIANIGDDPWDHCDYARFPEGRGVYSLPPKNAYLLVMPDCAKMTLKLVCHER